MSEVATRGQQEGSHPDHLVAGRVPFSYWVDFSALLLLVFVLAIVTH